MITARDVEFEQPQPKIFQLGEHSVALISGNAPVQASIATAAQTTILATKITNLEEIARLYATEFAAHRRKLASDEILAPLGLTTDLFLAQQQSMKPELVTALATQLQRYQVQGGMGRAIVAGADEKGGHIYVISEPGIETCMDSIGFVATGIGQRHAESQFMFEQYIKTWEFARALLLAYTAKKRAEVAPGVGSATDVVLITTAPRGIYHFVDSTDLVKILDRGYKSARRGERTTTDRAYRSVQESLEKLLTSKPAATVPAAAAPAVTAPATPAGGKS